MIIIIIIIIIIIVLIPAIGAVVRFCRVMNIMVTLLESTHVGLLRHDTRPKDGQSCTLLAKL